MKIEQFKTLLDDRAKDGVFAVNRDVYLDPELFELEMQHIFEASWLYLCHESQIPNAGDFFTTHMGRQPVVISRGKDGSRGQDRERLVLSGAPSVRFRCKPIATEGGNVRSSGASRCQPGTLLMHDTADMRPACASWTTAAAMPGD